MKSIILTWLVVSVNMALACPEGSGGVVEGSGGVVEGGRIASGANYARTEVPELCSIEIDFENKFMFCSCVVINAEWILTSLHCVYDQRELFGTVYVTSGSQKTKGILTIGFANLQIAYVKVAPSLIKSATTDFAQYSSTLETYTTNVNKTLLVCGFGNFDNQRNRYVEPQCSDMYIKSPDVCGLKNNANMLCGYWQNKDNNVCIGDFGGPLFTKSIDNNKRHMLVGISTYSLDMRPNANCLDGHKVIFYHVAAFGKDVLQYVNSFDQKFTENILLGPSLH